MFLKHNERIYNLSAYHEISRDATKPFINFVDKSSDDITELVFSTFAERDKAYETIQRMMGDKLFKLK